MNTGLIAAALLLTPSLAGCTSPASVAQPQAKDVTQVLNKKPKHVVRIEGRVPDSLQIEFDAFFLTDTKDMACFSQPGARLGQGPNYRAEPVEVSRKNGRYQATFTVDKYLPGACNWILMQVNAVIGKTGEPAEEAEVVERVIHTYNFYHEGSDASGCDQSPWSMDEAHCPVKANSFNTPVVIPCKVASYASNRPPKFDCPALTKANYKVSHRIKRGQKHVQINFYDLDSEPDLTQ